MSLEYQQEQKRVSSVMETIKEEKNRLEEETSRRKYEVIDIRKHFWEEVKVNTDTFDDYLETIIGLRQEAQALSVSQSSHQHATKRLSQLRRMEEIPYFGRIDFTEEGSSGQEQIYIGISTLSDTSGENFLIYDWRAPVSSVYYDYQPGPAKYETPDGVIEGNLEKKWQYLIRRGELQSMFDTSLTIGDEILQQVLGKGTDKQMHSIVATIQQEQNRIIRQDQGRPLIVHGAAGSGKTSAAMQRIAYLLYKYRGHLNADQIILFSPNSMFSSYVSNVLPELGEDNMQQVTFQEYLMYRLDKDFQVENPYEQLEYALTAANTPSYSSRVQSMQFKASIHFFKAIQSYRQSLELSGMVFKNITFRGEPLVTAQQLTEQFYRYDTSLRFPNRLEKLKDWLLKKIKEVQKEERAKPWVQEEIELLSNEDYHKAHAFLAEKRGYQREAIADYEMEPKALAQLIVYQKLKPLRKRISAYQFIDFKGIYKQLFTDPLHINNWLEVDAPDKWASICQETLNMLDENKLFYEDATPFLLLKELIQGFQINSSIKHIVVDEAQDYSPFQFEFLKRLFPATKMTVLGDFNQAIFTHASEHVNFDTLTNLYGSEKTELINISRSYRSTKPIIEFTRSLVPNGAQIIPFERDGERPALKKVTDYTELHDSIAEKVRALRQADYHSIAIICKSAEESYRAYESLASIDGIKLLKTTSSEYEQGVVVVPSYLSKGIEFDAVIIYDASEHIYNDESLRRIFYTACTRAMHDLQLYSVGEPSKFMRDALRDGLVETC
ncbi:UvrD-helicase domain-containing protein [Gracilibacillus caseinilyticus]|uniref:UvrD-helicase domain-containing protein n=1 Tax=Gracilibacillus caseinilyticus TaxID=2932256 RepID=A0ABY4ETA8_9BACI|nr:RNA polymerase recycling motor HelD [Gracilibacillus caseinilyticus]UOQ46859.1 UvrD-helicase domain-containing protein [Gracilibacillus caseinilyticus]